jgi:uncharacterized membrane protein
MTKCTITEFINVPIEHVFERMSDFENCPDRIENIVRVEMLTEGPVGVGTRFKETRVMFKREATEEMKVVEFNRPNSYALSAYSCGCEYNSRFRFKPKDGGTEVEMTFEGVPKKLLAKIMAFLMKPMMKMVVKECKKDLADVKQSLEKELVVN